MAFSSSEQLALEDWDAVETVARIRARDVSASEVIDAAIARAEAAAGLGAVASECFDRARADARALGGSSAPLAGVPTFVKDLAQLAGVRTRWGSMASGSFVSKKSDPFVSHLRDTGVVYLGKSAAPEFGLTATTEPIGQSPCRNPWNPEHSAGGSSGGAASLVAAGVVPIAHASDGGGSIRIPASVCGLVGLKPSRHRMDMEGSAMLPVNLATDGVVTRTVRDTVAFYSAIESIHPPRRVPAIAALRARPPRLRVAVFTGSPLGRPVHADAIAAAQGAARKCEALGHSVEEIPPPFEGEVLEDFLKYWGFLAFLQTRTARVMLHRGFDTSRFEPLSQHMSRYFTSQPRAVFTSIRRLRRFPERYAEVMRRYDVMICPTVAAAPPKLGHLATDLPFDTMFDRLKTYVPFTPLANAAGAPAISLPLGRSAEGLPLGVQFAAKYGDERTLLELATELEAAHPWPRTAPRQVAQRAGR